MRSEREAFGKKIIEHQAVAFRLADMATQIEAARQLVLHAARAARRRRAVPAGGRRWRSCSPPRWPSGSCSDAIQIHGGYGYVADFPVERIYRDVRVCQIYEGTSDIQRLVIARDLARVIWDERFGMNFALDRLPTPIGVLLLVFDGKDRLRALDLGRLRAAHAAPAAAAIRAGRSSSRARRAERDAATC